MNLGLEGTAPRKLITQYKRGKVKEEEEETCGKVGKREKISSA